jgi:glycosyltransferase involved in cell wall biosynthesis
LTIEPEDIGGMAAQLSLVASSEGVRDHLRAKGLARAKNFDWADAAAKTLKVYEQAYGFCRGWGIRPTGEVGFHAIGRG